MTTRERIAWALAAIVAASVGCSSWQNVRPATIAAGEVRLEGRRARFTAPAAPPLVVDVREVRYPIALGWDARARRWLTVDLSQVASVELRERNEGATAAVVLVGVLGGLAVTIAILALVPFAALGEL